MIYPTRQCGYHRLLSYVLPYTYILDGISSYIQLQERKLLISQVAEIGNFTKALSESCGSRAKGHDSRGSSKGSHNQKLTDSMEDIKTVSDLGAIQASPTSGVVGSIVIAACRLHRAGIIPCELTHVTARAAYDSLKKLSPADNKKLFKSLWVVAKDDVALRAYMYVVGRLWLIWPVESVVESMGSVLKAVFRDNRVLDHENAARELIIRWNGPDVAHADGLIERLLRRNPELNNCVRANISQAVEGTVIARHLSTRHPRSLIYPDVGKRN